MDFRVGKGAVGVELGEGPRLRTQLEDQLDARRAVVVNAISAEVFEVAQELLLGPFLALGGLFVLLFLTLKEELLGGGDNLLATIAAIPNLKTTARFAHPWFGPLDASGWHAMAGAR